MKLRAFLEVLGFRTAPRRYGHEVVAFELAHDGRVELARWRHPSETPKEITQEAIDHLRTFLRPGDAAIDIGAHTGDTTVPIALAVGAQGCVLALEPNPYVFPVLERNAALNAGKAMIVPLNFAATPTTGPIQFEYSDAGFCNGGRHEGVSRWRHGHAFRLTVRGENLQHYVRTRRPEVAGRLRFIKVDAEGYDLAVLESISELIEQERPFIRAEVHKLVDERGRRRLFGFFASRRYVVRRVVSDDRYRGEQLSRADMSRWRQFDVFAEPE